MSGAIHLGTDTEFARAFAAAWANPTTERLVALLDEEVVLRQPHLPPIRGRAAARAEFDRLFAWLPTLHGVTDRTISAPGVATIEWRLVFPIGARGTTIPMVDCFRVRNGLALERVVYFDQVPLLLAVLARPWLVPGFLRYRLGG